MSRIQAHILSQLTHPCGRLVLEGHLDSSTHVADFHIPSSSRADRVYGLQLDCRTSEVACACERWDYRVRSAGGRREYGTELEVEAREAGWFLYPSILRAPKGLCPHSRRVRTWVRRHGLTEAMQVAYLDTLARLRAKIAARDEESGRAKSA